MARQRPEPRHITLGGREAVALTVEEYAQLIASRRQIGGQSARVRVLAQQVKRTERLLEELEALVGGPTAACRTADEGAGRQAAADCHGHHDTTGDTDTDCLRCAIAALLRRHRDATA
ncbi:hypothetical protein [Streptomyces sp. Ag109_G2-15]|uniref:hypothetical protein n=1 Tax=Streptomyces sp. Ag109_G2-15 TaxID=1938850 RepID=UPI000BD388F9|nr:hypothetical protein [Streptomyces sp. Ag109_G2-15]SOE06862.1 hypothetical protein SAMN06272765_7730 [Streptomyces sp. Ag109_G2-15]